MSERSLTYASSVLPSERPRARPLCPADRRSHILDAAVPLLIERGPDATTREIAERAGVAEGTLFRVFRDKAEIISAARARYADPGAFHDSLREIDPTLPLEELLRTLVLALQERFDRVVGMALAFGRAEHLPRSPEFSDSYLATVETILAPHAPDLRRSPAEIARLLRSLALAQAVPEIAADHRFSADDIVDILLPGLLRTPAL